METTLIDQGLSLMLFGMGTVFVFLAVLVFATTTMSAIVNKLASEDSSDNTSETDEPPTGSQYSSQLVDVIEKAIATHRAKK